MPLALNIFNNEIQTVVPDYTTVTVALSSDVDASSSFAILSSKNFTQGNFLPLSGGTLTGFLSSSQGVAVRNGLEVSGKTTFLGTITGIDLQTSPVNAPAVSFQLGAAVPGGLTGGPSFAVNRGQALQPDSVAINYGRVQGAGTSSVAIHSGNVVGGSNNLALNSAYAYGFNSIASGLSYSGANYSVAFGDECFAAGNSCFAAGRKTTAGTPVYFVNTITGGSGIYTFTFSIVSGPPLPFFIKVVSLTDTFGNTLNPPYEAIIQNPSTIGIAPWRVSGTLLRGNIPQNATGYIVYAGGSGLGNNAIAFGQSSSAFGEDSFVTGYFTQASGARSNAHGAYSKALNDQSFAFGNRTIAWGLNTVVEGVSSQAIGDQSHAEGNGSIASGLNSHSEGYETRAIGDQSHAEGFKTTADGLNSVATGYFTRAGGDQSFSYGYQTSAMGFASNAFGLESVVDSGTIISFAGGFRAKAAHSLCWVYNGMASYPAGSYFSSTRSYQFAVQASGGIYFNSNVGINTDSVDNALSVNGSISANNNIVSSTFTGDTFITTPSNVVPKTDITYTLVLSDNGRLITFDNPSSISVNLPDGLPVGFSASFIQLGTGQISFFPVGAALMFSDSNKFKIASQYSMATVVSHSINTFVLAGNISL